MWSKAELQPYCSYFPKDRFKTDSSTGQNRDKKIDNNYADVIAATISENSHIIRYRNH